MSTVTSGRNLVTEDQLQDPCDASLGAIPMAVRSASIDPLTAAAIAAAGSAPPQGLSGGPVEGSCPSNTVQVVRSVGSWSLGGFTEDSIQRAWIREISNAKVNIRLVLGPEPKQESEPTAAPTFVNLTQPQTYA